MSGHDQCPSSKKAGLPADVACTTGGVSAATGKAFWRSLDELAETPEFRDRLQREFPAFASELSEESRRDFMKIMGAGLALAGAVALPACRRPDHKILTYNRDPEHVVPGVPLFYATAMPMPGGGAQGLLAKTHEGRPTKVEGNPLHPVNRGRSDSIAQASVLSLYDPDRSTSVRKGAETSDWAAFESFARGHFAKFDASKGAGLAFLVEKATSPSRDWLRGRIKARWPQASWLPYEAIDQSSSIEGVRSAFGEALRPTFALEKAKVIVSLGRDFLSEPGGLSNARGFATGRTVRQGKASEAEMNRLYVIESMMTITGGSADHRLRLKPSDAVGVSLALLKAVLEKAGRGDLAGSVTGANGHGHEAWVDAAADDLVAAHGACAVMAGESMPAGVHALVCAANEALGATSGVVSYVRVGEDVGASSLESIRRVSEGISGGSVDTLVVIGCNPVFDAPADLEFAAKYTKVPTTVHLGVNLDETAVASTWHINRAHYLESWGDVASWDGTISCVQPMIAPIFGGKTELELLGVIAGDEERDGYGMVRRTWREMTGLRDEAFEKSWKRALHDGFLAGSAPKSAAPKVKNDGVSGAARGVAAVKSGEMEALFLPDAKLWDGRFANNGWLQEQPHPTTKVTWDNPAMLSPATAARLGVSNTDTVEVSVGGRTVRMVAWVVPGLADDTVALEMGQGRATGGRLCVGTGFNVYAVRGTDGMSVATDGVSVRKGAGAAVDRAYAGIVACTQDHHSMEDRPLIREIDLAAWKKHGDTVFESKDAYGNKRSLALGEQLGDLSHTPLNRDVYLERQRHAYRMDDPEAGRNRRQQQMYPLGRQQWGMSIDLTTCTGCGACVTACQSENNIPVIGKAEVWKGREMHWIRVDRYFAGSVDDPEMAVQPVNCMHCENAPCETVCPVNATIHGPEGTNDMAYNRCIGTRYCSNNCPYKVRRFNWFDYATKDFKGGFGQLGKGLPEDLMPRNEAFVPPRLRAEISELETLQRNPNVTVRSRGVMEKCTYCLQRINRARVETKLQDLKGIPDGFFEVACQQACPSESIVFGDISDPTSEASALRTHGRTYAMLGYLNTAPRTTYMVRLRNPNPRIRKPVEDPPALHHGEHGGDHGETSGGHGEGHANGTRRLSLPVLGQAPSDASRRGAVASVLAGVLS